MEFAKLDNSIGIKGERKRERHSPMHTFAFLFNLWCVLSLACAVCSVPAESNGNRLLFIAGGLYKYALVRQRW